MKAADLLTAQAVDTRGRRLGKVHDIRLTRAPGDARWQIDSIIVGPSAVAYRLGYANREVTGPRLLAAAMRLLVRGRHPIPWSQVQSYDDGRLVVLPQPHGDRR